jgi:hypothetical protein
MVYEEIIMDAISKKVSEYISNLPPDYVQTSVGRCCQILDSIREILENDTYSDFECVDQIILLMERNGIQIENRHDF